MATKQKTLAPAALTKGKHGTVAFRAALSKLGARRKDGAPIRTDVIYAAAITGVKADAALELWRLAYPTATPHQVSCYYPGGVFAENAKKLKAFVNGAAKKKK